tara:strand:- start:975 stop:1355 length:381 start_codon:yes stop_codon:yes gene_type:complete
MEDIKFYDILGQAKLSFGDINDFPHYPSQDASGMPIFPVGSSITTEEFKIRYDEVEQDYSINKLRIERNVLLKDSDWSMMSDLDLANKDEWITYRQALRDLPKTQSGVTTDIAGNLIDAVFPIKPE